MWYSCTLPTVCLPRADRASWQTCHSMPHVRTAVAWALTAAVPVTGLVGVPTLPGASLLLVDDQVGMRSAAQRYLSERGFACRAVSSAEEALRAMATEPPPDALITDILMPGGMDGLDLLRAIRTDRRLCAMPVILLSAKGFTADRIAGYDAGASAYLTKPFDPDELVSVARALTTNALLARGSILYSEVTALRTELATLRQQLHQRTGDEPITPDARRQLAAAGDASASTALTAFQKLAAPGQGQRSPPPVHLTRRERSVLELVGEGQLNKEIASQLGVGLRYVEKVVARLLEKTGTANRTALVRRSLQMGLLTDGGRVETAANVFVTDFPGIGQ